MPKIPGDSHGRPSHQSGHQKAKAAYNARNKKKGCCSMVAAVRSAKDGNWRLAGRYARMTPRYIARRFA